MAESVVAYKTFYGLGVSSKWGICGLPIRFDTYNMCGFGCKYCFSNNRCYMGKKSKELRVAILSQLDIVLNGMSACDRFQFLQELVKRNITWHCGSLSDPFQPIEAKLRTTSKAIDITNRYGVSILFSTKSNTAHNANIRPDLHTFQLSVTNVDDRTDIEPNVPTIQSRIDFFKSLKKDGFKVGVRIQPFIPNISTLDIVKAFEGADHFTMESIKLPIDNADAREDLLRRIGLKMSDFYSNASLYKLLPDARLSQYRPFLEYFTRHGISYSIADNDMRWLTNNYCCCGDALIKKHSGIDTTSMIMRHGFGWTLRNVEDAVNELGIAAIDAAYYCPDKDRHGSRTVIDFVRRRYASARSPMSPRYQYYSSPSLFD